MEAGTRKKDRSAGYRFKDRQVRVRRDDKVLNLEDKSAYDAELSHLNQLSARLSIHSRSCARFIPNPPIDPSIRANEHKGLNEIILTSIIMQADKLSTGASETLGRRREIVYEALLLLASLDEMAKHSKERATRDQATHSTNGQPAVKMGPMGSTQSPYDAFDTPSPVDFLASIANMPMKRQIREVGNGIVGRGVA
jgi:hypothetical protein